VLVADVDLAASTGELPLTEIQRRYPLAPVTALHDKVTGEVTVEPSAGELSVAVAPHVACVPLVKVDLAETMSGHPAKDVTTHHVSVPPGTSVVSDVSEVVPARSPEPLASAMKSLKLVAPETAVHLNVTGEVRPVAPLAGARSVVGVVLQVTGVVTLSVKTLENVDEGQSPKSASTYQASPPCGTVAVSVVAVVLPIVNRSLVTVADCVPQTT
jgi:hypothetical protein